MFNPCLSIVTYKRSRIITNETFFNLEKSLRRAPENFRILSLVDYQSPGMFVTFETIPKQITPWLLRMIKNKNKRWFFTYYARTIVLFGCVVVMADMLDCRFAKKSSCFFLLT